MSFSKNALYHSKQLCVPNVYARIPECRPSGRKWISDSGETIKNSTLPFLTRKNESLDVDG